MTAGNLKKKSLLRWFSGTLATFRGVLKDSDSEGCSSIGEVVAKLEEVLVECGELEIRLDAGSTVLLARFFPITSIYFLYFQICPRNFSTTCLNIN
jgi:hypothetical protein